MRLGSALTLDEAPEGGRNEAMIVSFIRIWFHNIKFCCGPLILFTSVNKVVVVNISLTIFMLARGSLLPLSYSDTLHNLISCIIALPTCMWFLCYVDTWWEWSGCNPTELTTVGHDCQVNLKVLVPWTKRLNTLLNNLWVMLASTMYKYLLKNLWVMLASTRNTTLQF